MLVFISGTVWGSFLEVITSRLRTSSKEGYLDLGGFSFCPRCQHRLYGYDLIPLVSFLFLRGRCRYCRQPIGLSVFLIELFSGLFFSLAFLRFGWGWDFIFACFLSSVLLVIFFYDLKTMLIPDGLLLVLLALWLIGHIFKISPLQDLSIEQSLLGGVLVFGFFFLFYYFSQGKWFGFGDVKLGGVLGLFWGWKLSVVFVWLSFICGGIVAILLLLLKIRERQSLIPFAPFLVTSFFVLYFFPQARDFLVSFL